MRFRGLDLNLLMALEALLELRSVSRAAERLNVSQPAMSAALSRLRDYFGDDVLVSNGKRMYPTAFAESLVPHLNDCLRYADALVSTSRRFDPTTSQRSFLIVASDYIVTSVLTRLVSFLADTAPGIRLDIVAPTDDSTPQLAEGKVDLLITAENFIHPDHPASLLFEERYVVVGWQGNPLFTRTLTEADFLASGHVAVAFGRNRTASFADRQLATLGKERRVEVTTAFFTAVPWLLRHTQRISLMHERLARTMSEFYPLVTAPVPFEFPIMREMMQCHVARVGDDGLRWLREQIEAAARRADIDAVDTHPSGL